ncbi:MAG: ankyrin repeat domain-containing protein, partial [Vicinamibacterales bacterium]
SERRLPVRPNLDQLKHQAKNLLRELRVTNPAAGLADAQFALAREYQASSWPRLVHAVRLANAIWDDDIDTVRELVTGNPQLLHEQVLIRTNSNWGPPLTYAANLGRDRIIRMLHELGATDLETALDRAALQGQVQTGLMLHAMMGRPKPPDDSLGGPAYTLSAEGTAFLLGLGVRVVDQAGRRLAPVDVVLQTDSRRPAVKHAILEMYEKHGLEYPDTAPMALHRGRIDLLEKHLHRDPGLLTRTFSHREIYPAEMGCGDPLDATTGTPLDGTTLLHMCADYDEIEIARWLLDRGMDPNARAAVGASGFGGYTALFSTVVSQPNFWMNFNRRGPFVAPFAELLLERGADPNVRASIWKRLHPGHGDPARHDYRDVTALSWGRRFHAPIFVSEPAMRLIESAGGME